MSDIPFLNPAVLKQLDLPVPNRDLTPQVLSPLNLNTLEEPSRDLLAYRKLYGLHLLECDHWQGYVQMPLFRLHVQVFKPKVEKYKVQFVYCMVILSIVVSISQSFVKFLSRALVSLLMICRDMD